VSILMSELIMANGGSLMEQFISQELNASVRSVLNGALDERVLSDDVLLREFEFNCFDVVLGFKRGVVRLPLYARAGCSMAYSVVRDNWQMRTN